MKGDIAMLVFLYEAELRKEPMWYTKIVELKEGALTRMEVSRLQDLLMDRGLLDCRYEMVDGKWTSCWHLTYGGMFLGEQVRKFYNGKESETNGKTKEGEEKAAQGC